MAEINWPSVDEFAQHIRWLNGSNKMGAGVLAERLLEWLQIRAIATAHKTALDSFIDDVEAADIRDAARYRYLLETRNCEFDPTDPWYQLVVIGPDLGDGLKAKLDAAIDVAIEGGNHG